MFKIPYLGALKAGTVSCKAISEKFRDFLVTEVKRFANFMVIAEKVLLIFWSLK
jgi:hypothetical protein